MKCPYCRGKGEKTGIFFKKKKTCKNAMEQEPVPSALVTENPG